ncbi:MAG: PhoH family protein [Clostridia bacterium]|nr:PhoH family protein [Clostridia bacterium]
MFERYLTTDTLDQTCAIFGNFDLNIQTIESEFNVRIYNSDSESAGGSKITVRGEDEQKVTNAYYAVAYLKRLSSFGNEITTQSVDYAVSMVKSGNAAALEDFGSDCICVTTTGKPVKAKTVGQKAYVEAIKKNTVVIGIGPAGTGKTFLAVAMATAALRNKEVNRIILTRPAVEAGEKLGFLPGDLQNKIDPYLRPLHDALREMLGPDGYARCVEKGVIEIAPLAYMRGRTLDDSFIILDEAQNTTGEQMKMFLTRLGFRSKAVVTGDITQIDLPRGQKSGLKEAVKILDVIDDIAIHRFSEKDVVRHRLVQKIILAYDKYENKHREDATRTKK